MALVTLNTLEQALSRRIGDYVTGAASGAGNAGGTTFPTTSNDILTRPGQYWVPYLVQLTSGTYSGQVRQVSDFTVAAGVGTFTVVNAFGGQVASAVTFNLHRLPLVWKYESISDMLREAGDCLPKIIVEEFLSGELLRNPSMEQWSNDVPYDWVAGAGTITRDTGTLYQGSSSLKLVGTSSRGEQRIFLEQEMNGYTLKLTGWVRGKIANAPRLRISVGATDTTSATVTADDTWQELSCSVALTDATKPIFARLINNHATEAAHFDALRLKLQDNTSGDAISTTTLAVSAAFVRLAQVWTLFDTTPSATVQDWSSLIRPPQHVFNGYGHLRQPLTADYPMRMVGTGVWPELSASTDTVEIELHQVPLVANRAGQKLMMKAIAHDHLGDTAKWKGILAMLVTEEPRLVSRLGIIPPSQHLPLGNR